MYLSFGIILNNTLLHTDVFSCNLCFQYTNYILHVQQELSLFSVREPLKCLLVCFVFVFFSFSLIAVSLVLFLYEESWIK